MDKIIDTRGRSCPEPILMVREEIEKNNPKSLKILCDTKVSVNNVSKVGERFNFKVNIIEDEESQEFTLEFYKD